MVIGCGNSGFALREVDLVGNARGGTAQLDNVPLSMGGTALAERLVLHGKLRASENSTLCDTTITIAPLAGANRESIVGGRASLGAARITISNDPNALLMVGQNATGGTAAMTMLGQGRFDISLMTLPR